jgi:hypothetical protein
MIEPYWQGLIPGMGPCQYTSRALLVPVNNPEEDTGGYETNRQRHIGTEMQPDLEISRPNDYSKRENEAENEFCVRIGLFHTCLPSYKIDVTASIQLGRENNAPFPVNSSRFGSCPANQ